MLPTHCLITDEFAGINPSGGIGACCKGLAGLLIRQGYAVDVLITDLSLAALNMARPTTDAAAPRFLFLRDVLRSDKAVAEASDPIAKAFCVYRFLKMRDYTVVHFNDWMGAGFYCAMAKRQGLFQPHVVTHLHGGSEWVRRHNLHSPDLDDFEREAIERSQIENSDEVIAPSQYMLDYYREAGLTLPCPKVHHWILPQYLHGGDWQAEPGVTRPIAAATIDELIFFGRHERRKGFGLFIDAVSRLPLTHQPNLTFIGRFDRISREFTGSHALRRLAAYGGRIRFFDKLDQVHALSKILRTRNALCIMPSIVENSPCVIGECLAVGAPFLTTDVGGVAELIAPESRPHCLVAPEPRALAQAIERRLVEGQPPIRASFAPRDAAAAWIDWLDGLQTSPQGSERRSAAGTPLVSVCITHYERPRLLQRALRALMAQTYPNIEIVIVDDGSKRPDAVAYIDALSDQSHRFPITLIRSENRYLGAARNLAAANAKGEYLLFHDDDNFAEPHEVDTFVRAAQHSGFAILTSQYWVFEDDDESSLKKRKMKYFPIGVGGAISFFRNRFGDANALFERATFEALGGFTELRDVGWEDWELFLKAYLRGIRMGVVPEPLFNYRVSPKSMLATGDVLLNHERLFVLVDHEMPKLNADILRYAQRHAMQQQILDRTWRTLEESPEANLHQQLTAESPASDEARAKLSDLAFALGRIDDAIEIGASNYHQREKMLALMSHLKHLPKPISADEVIIKPDFSDAAPAYYMSGWAFYGPGTPVIPRQMLIDGIHFETVACVDRDRSDVHQQFSLPDTYPLGFFLAVRKTIGANGTLRHLLARRRRRLTAAGRPEISVLDCPKGTKVHIDHIVKGAQVSIDVPADFVGRLAVSVNTSEPDKVLLSTSRQAFFWAQRVNATTASFDLSSESQQLTLILPPDPNCYIVMRHTSSQQSGEVQPTV